jgi:hypothetical protein
VRAADIIDYKHSTPDGVDLAVFSQQRWGKNSPDCTCRSGQTYEIRDTSETLSTNASSLHYLAVHDPGWERVEPRPTSSFITFEDQGSAAVQTATDNEGSVEDQITNRENRILTTRHQVDVAGRVLTYTARAGRLPIIDNE